MEETASGAVIHPASRHRHYDAAVLATHSRPALPIHAPSQIEHAVVLVGERDAAGDRQLFLDVIGRMSWNIVEQTFSEVVAVNGDSTIKWERHTEFITLTATAKNGLGNLTLPATFETLLTQLTPSYGPQDGSEEGRDRGLFARSCILLGLEEHDLDVAAGDQAMMKVRVVGDSFLVSTTLQHDASRVIEYRATLLEHGLEAMSPERIGRFVQRLVEIESYRLLAYLAVPLMQTLGPRVSDLEARVNDIARRAAADPEPEEEQAILTELTSLSAELQSIGSASEFRFAASLAYSAIVNERIESLREQRVEGFQRISTAIKRRLDPAMRSCSALLRRQEKTAERIGYVTDLLRTRVDLALQDQNTKVLASIDERAKAQLRLQQAVEGLSVAAITYYTVSIIAYLVDGALLERFGVEPNVVKALAVIPVGLVVYLGLRRVRAHNEAVHDAERP